MNAHIHTVASRERETTFKIMIIQAVKRNLRPENKGIFKFTQRKLRKEKPHLRTRSYIEYEKVKSNLLAEHKLMHMFTVASGGKRNHI